MAMAKVRIQEIRKLLLPVETVVDAILELDRSHGGALAGAKLAEVRVVTGADPGLSLILVQGSGNAAATLEKHFTLPAVAAAAIHYCFRARIPLPRQGTKSIEITPEGFQLTIQTVTEVLRLHGEAPKASQVERAAVPESGPSPHEAIGDAALIDPTVAETDPSGGGEAAGAAAPEAAVDAPASAAA
jgi:hypothetical protein